MYAKHLHFYGASLLPLTSLLDFEIYELNLPFEDYWLD
jgi:hypothetical protein